MGIKGSATCVLNFDGASAELVGEPHTGMAQMFTMMNRARLGVGVQGIGIGEIAYQSALAYARERRQGRAPGTPRRPGRPDHRPRRRAPGAAADARADRGRTGAGPVGGCRDGCRPAPSRPGAAAGGRRPGGAADAGDQGCLHRQRRGGGQPGDRRLRRPRLHRRVGGRAARPRRPHQPDLRGHQRRPGARPRGAQAADAPGPAAAPVLPPDRRPAGATTRSPAPRRSTSSWWRRFAGSRTRRCGWRRRACATREEAAAAATDYLRMFSLVVFGSLWLRMAEECLGTTRPTRSSASRSLRLRGSLPGGSCPRPPRLQR